MAASAAAPSTARDNIPHGILYMVGATMMFAVSAAIIKWMLALYPLGEVAFLRQLFSLLFCAAVILPRTGLAVFRTARPGQHALRGVSQFVSQICLMVALTMMPLGAAMSISFSAPLFAVLLAVLLFRERVSLHRGAALVAGFAGVLLITDPSAAGIGAGALWALANAVLYASVTVAVRRMSASESADTLTMHQMVALTLLMALLLPFGFVAPEPIDVVLLGLAGYAAGLGQLWWTRALGLAPSSAVMPFYYLSLAWAIGLGFLVWGDMPDETLIGGAAVVVASGLYLIWRESLERRRAIPAPARRPARRSHAAAQAAGGEPRRRR